MSGTAAADPISFPLPLDSPVSIDLVSNSIVTFGPRTIDFTDNLDQKFIAFTPVVREVAPVTFRSTIAVRARDGLAELMGSFPPPPMAGFPNQVPAFSFGTNNLLAFDVLISGWNTPYSVSLVDLDGHRHQAMFANPVPEPSSILLVGGGAVALMARARRRAKRRTRALRYPSSRLTLDSGAALASCRFQTKG